MGIAASQQYPFSISQRFKYNPFISRQNAGNALPGKIPDRHLLVRFRVFHLNGDFFFRHLQLLGVFQHRLIFLLILYHDTGNFQTETGNIVVVVHHCGSGSGFAGGVESSGSTTGKSRRFSHCSAPEGVGESVSPCSTPDGISVPENS